MFHSPKQKNQPQRFSGMLAVYYQHFLINQYRYFKQYIFDNREFEIDYIKISFSIDNDFFKSQYQYLQYYNEYVVI